MHRNNIGYHNLAQGNRGGIIIVLVYVIIY
jgi:hypothetical protein